MQRPVLAGKSGVVVAQRDRGTSLIRNRNPP